MDPIKTKIADLWYIYTGEEASLGSGRLIKDAGLDSLARLELALDIEDQFDISIPDGEEDRFGNMTIEDLIEFVKSKTGVLCWSCEKRAPMKGHGQCACCRDNQ